MKTFDTLIQRNRDFAAHRFARTESFASTLNTVTKACIIGCADPRVDPVYVLGLEPGEAVVIRNIGGRLTPGTLQQMGLLGRIAQVAEANPGVGTNFTSSCCSTPTARSLAWEGIPRCLIATLKSIQKDSRPNRSWILEPRLRSMRQRSRPIPLFQVGGWFLG